MNNQKQTTVVIAEDQAIIREGLVLVCQSRDLQVVAQCADGLAALDSIRSLKPDFALLDKTRTPAKSRARLRTHPMPSFQELRSSC